MSQRGSPAHHEPATRIVGFDISHDDRVAKAAKDPKVALDADRAVPDNESPTSVLELSQLPAGPSSLNESPTQASLVSSQSKASLSSSSSSAMISHYGDESPPKSHLAEELRRHASLSLDNASDDHVRKGLPRLKIQRN